jgi:hypothetical protein
MSFYNVSNRATFTHCFGGTTHPDEGQIALRARVVEVVLATTVIGH